MQRLVVAGQIGFHVLEEGHVSQEEDHLLHGASVAFQAPDVQNEFHEVRKRRVVENQRTRVLEGCEV